MRNIVVQPYNPMWAKEFEKALAFYSSLLRDLDVQIEHVGSTSVEGLWAKPILDIDIIVVSQEDSDAVIRKLKSVDYNHIGNYGVEGREALKYQEDNKYITWMQHNLYVCMAGTENVINHFMLRRHLRNNKSAVEAYSKIKQELAAKYPHDIDSYIDGKTDLITSFLEKEGMDPQALDRIRGINKK